MPAKPTKAANFLEEFRKRTKVPAGHQRKPQLYWHTKSEKGWRYFPAPNGEQSDICRQYPDGKMFIRERLPDGRRIFTQVKEDAARELQNARRRAENAQYIDRLYRPAKLSEEIDRYIEDRKGVGRIEAAENGRLVLQQFQEACPHVRSVKEINREHLIQFTTWCREQGFSKRTVSNKYDRLRSFLKFAGNMHARFNKDDRPKFDKKRPTTYSPAEISALLKHADDYMTLVIDMGRQLGLREQEMAHAEFDDILHNRHYRVQSKPLYEFAVKDSEERDVPVPPTLYKRLQDWKKKHAGQALILGIGKDGKRVNGHLLRWLQRVAKQAGVKNATLHRLRRTYITTLVESNTVSVRKAQELAGHSDLESTMRYLNPTKDVRNAIDQLFG